MALFEQIAIKVKTKKLKKMGFDDEFIEKNEMISLEDDELDYMKSNEEAIRLIADVLAEVKRTSFSKAYEKVKNAKEKYGIEPEDFAFNGLFHKKEEAVAAFAKKQRAAQLRNITKIARVTGWSQDKAREEVRRAYEIYGITPSEYYTELYYNMTDEEISAKKEAEKKEFQRCIDWVKSETGWTDYQVKRHRYYCRLAHEIVLHAYFPTRCWQMDDATLKGFARQRDSKRLKEKYNDKKAISVLADKVRFNREFGELTGRKFWLNRNTAYEDFLEFVDGLDELFCKPVNLAHAAGTRRIKVEGDMRELYNSLISQPKTLVEECVKQHHEMDEFYDGAVNTVRIFCLLDKGRFVPFADFVRFGVEGVADNIVAGGVGCGLNVETGTIDTPAIDRWHMLHDTHPVSGKRFEGFKIPNWDLVLDVAEKGLRRVEGINYVGWDIAVCEDRAVLIEGNSLPSISTYQMFYGCRHEGKRHAYKKYLNSRLTEIIKTIRER